MILSKTCNALDYTGIHHNLDVALNHITDEFLLSLGPARVNIADNDVYCTKFTYETVADEDSFFEAHKKYLDIHLMLEGSEQIEIAPPQELEQFRSEPENDFYAYHGNAHYRLTLVPGDFLVVFPSDAHKLKMKVGNQEIVSKAVFKVKIK